MNPAWKLESKVTNNSHLKWSILMCWNKVTHLFCADVFLQISLGKPLCINSTREPQYRVIKKAAQVSLSFCSLVNLISTTCFILQFFCDKGVQLNQGKSYVQLLCFWSNVHWLWGKGGEIKDCPTPRHCISPACSLLALLLCAL